MTDPQRQLSWADRFRGALLGGAVGDSLGAGVRHTTTAEIQQWFGPRGVVDYLPVYGRRGAVTDLTQLTAFTLEGLLRAKAEGCTGLPTEFVFANHLRWLHTQGVPWEYAMAAFAATEPAPASWLLERRELYSTRNPAGNALGLLGRMAARSPLGPDGLLHPPVDVDGSADYPVIAAPAMVWSNVPEGVYAAGAGVANLFTSGANSIAAAGLHADVLAQLIRGIPLWDAVTSSDQRRLNAAYRVPGVPADVRRTVHAAMFVGQRGGTPGPLDIDIEFDVVDKPGELGIALAAVGSTRTFADAVQVAVNNSADSAVTGALAGQLAGALHGPAAIPAPWLDELELRQVIETLCGDAAEAFAPPPPPQWAQRYTRGPQPQGSRQIAAGPAKTVEGSAEQTMVMPAIRDDSPPPAAQPAPRPPAQPTPPPQTAAAPAPITVPEPPIEPEPPVQEDVPRFESQDDARIGAPTFPARADVREPEQQTETTAVFAAIGDEPEREQSPVDLDMRSRTPIDLDPGEAEEPEPEVEQPAPVLETPLVDLAPEPESEPEQETESEPEIEPEREIEPEAVNSQVGEAPADSDEDEGSTVVDISGIGSPFDLIAVPQRDENDPAPDARFTRDADPEYRFTDADADAGTDIDSGADSGTDAEPESTPIDLSPEPDAVPAVARLSAVEPEPEPDEPEPAVAESDVAGSDVLEEAVPEAAADEAVADEDATEPEDVEDAEALDSEEDATHEDIAEAEAEPMGIPLPEVVRAPEERLVPTAEDRDEEDVALDEESALDEDAALDEESALDEDAAAVEEAEVDATTAVPDTEVPAFVPGTADETAGTAAGATPADTGVEVPAEPEPQVVEAPPISGGRRVHAKNEGPGDAAPSLTERVLGCFLGGALGDALGADLEFATAAQITERFGPTGPSGLREAYGVHGAITDDTQMTLFTAEGLIRGSIAARALGVEDPLPEVQLAYQRWLHTQGVEWDASAGPFLDDHPMPDGWLVEVPGLFRTRAPGKTIFRALTDFGDGNPAGSLTQKINDSKGCGGAMRAAPASLTSTDPAEVFELAARTAALTHSHPAGYHSAGALAVIVQQALLGRSLDDGVWLALQVLETWEDHEETTEAIKAAVGLAAEGVPSPERIAEVLGGGWVGEQAVAIAVCAALAAGDDVELALKIAVHHDGDSDSTGAICGNIVGALQGVGELPLDWLAELELRDVIEQMALDCVAEFGRGGFQPGRAAIEPPSDQDWNERYPVRPKWSAEPATVGAEAGGFPSPKPAPRRRLDGVAHTETAEGNS